MRSSHKYLLATCVLFVGVPMYCFVKNAVDSDGPLGPVGKLVVAIGSPNISPNAYVGWTEAEIFREWGKPQEEWDGHYGCPPDDYVKQHNPARTLLFKRWTGALYVSLEMRDGEWICFSSDWLPKGAAF